MTVLCACWGVRAQGLPPACAGPWPWLGTRPREVGGPGCPSAWAGLGLARSSRVLGVRGGCRTGPCTADLPPRSKETLTFMATPPTWGPSAFWNGTASFSTTEMVLALSERKEATSIPASQDAPR